VAIGLVVLDVAQRMPMRCAAGRVVVVEGRLQPVAVVALLACRFGWRRHDDVAVALGAVGAMRVLDDLQQPVPVRFRIMVMTVLVLVIVPMRH